MPPRVSLSSAVTGIQAIADNLKTANAILTVKQLHEIGDKLQRFSSVISVEARSMTGASNGSTSASRSVKPPGTASASSTAITPWRSSLSAPQQQDVDGGGSNNTLAPFILGSNSTPQQQKLRPAPPPGGPAAPSSSRGAARSVCRTLGNDVLPASLYLALEAVVVSLKGENGALYVHVPGTEQLVAVVLVGYGSLPPSQMRCAITSSHPGSVLSTGIAVHCELGGSNTQPHLYFPLRHIQSNDVIGVVHVGNKSRGTMDFTELDEQMLLAYTSVLSYILLRYPRDVFKTYFDPMHLHTIVPWQPAPKAETLLPPIIAQHVVPQMIHRTVQSKANLRRSTAAAAATSTNNNNNNSNSNISDAHPLAGMGDDVVAAIGSTPTLREVSSYLRNLQECWRRSVQCNVDLERSQDGRTDQLRKVREELRQRTTEVGQLHDTLRKHTMSGGDYTKEYERLERDLAGLLTLRRGTIPLHTTCD
eukprot:PhM_4_TR12397/c0_g1_i1/m.10949